jgi:hypothetical protein
VKTFTRCRSLNVFTPWSPSSFCFRWVIALHSLHRANTYTFWAAINTFSVGSYKKLPSFHPDKSHHRETFRDIKKAIQKAPMPHKDP